MIEIIEDTRSGVPAKSEIESRVSSFYSDKNRSKRLWFRRRKERSRVVLKMQP